MLPRTNWKGFSEARPRYGSASFDDKRQFESSTWSGSSMTTTG